MDAATITLAVDGMTCASCVARVERALLAVPGVTDANVNLATERATVHGVADESALIAAVEKTGYDARAIVTAARDDGDVLARKEAERAALWRDVLIAAALALPVFVLEMGSHMIPAMHHWIGHTLGTQTSWVIQCVLTTLVLLIPGRRFYIAGFPALLRLAPDMNSLVAVGTLAAYAY